MANEKLVTLDQLNIVKGYIDAADAKAIKSAEYADNKITLYTTADKSGDAAVEIDLPEEMFLDQAKTTFVDEFYWTNTAYPGTENPDLNGKPVLVLAVKGDETVSYSFVSIEALVKVYTGEDTDTSEVTVEDGAIKVDVKLSVEEGNALVKKDDGLYVAAPEVPEEIVYATNEEVEALFKA
ncbi:MAG: hypothetical protein HDT44_01220 [Ruminococcaceae bacterium]|nr:hypothetical protein [Oscillospiraceae bacterium]